MKRISAKIVVCLLLTLVLWGGLNFNFQKVDNGEGLPRVAVSAEWGVGNA